LPQLLASSLYDLPFRYRFAMALEDILSPVLWIYPSWIPPGFREEMNSMSALSRIDT
jgi:hypothetical protein